MVKLEVGKPLPGGLGPGPEGIAYEAPNGEHTLFVRLEDITDAEASAFRTAQARMALVSKGQSLFLCFRIEGVLDWSDAVFNIHRYAPEQRVIPVAAHGEHLALTMLLVEARSTVLRGARVVTYSKHATQVLLHQMRRQLADPYPPHEEDAFVASVQRLYPDTSSLVREALFNEKLGLDQ